MLFMAGSVFASAQKWEASYSDALSASAEEDKPIILVFAGSDWCAPCIKLDRSIWKSEQFIDYSMANYVLYKADFPRKKSNQLPPEIAHQNSELAKTYNPNGFFPFVVVMNSKQQVLGTTGYKKITPDAYISLLNSFIK